MDAVDDCLAEDVVFLSSVAQTPYPGKLITSAILRAVFEVFEGFPYVRQLREGSEEAYVITATIDGLDMTGCGCEFLTLDEEGKIAEFMVMTRPLKASQAPPRPPRPPVQ